MYQTIGEKIRVAGVFEGRGFTPKKFEWRATVYPIEQVTLQNDVKDGGIRKRFYSVVSGVNVYRIVFNRENEQWELAELWFEG